MNKWIMSCVALLLLASTALGADATNLAQTVSGPGAPDLVFPMPTALKDAIVSSGKTAVEDFVVTQGDAVTWAGIYVGVGGPGDLDDTVEDGWFTTSILPNTDPTRINIWCDIELYNKITIENYNVYFHRSGVGTTGAQSAYVKGKVEGNHNSWIGLSTVDCDPELMVWRSDALGRTKDPLNEDIAVVYGLADNLNNTGVDIWGADETTLNYRAYDNRGEGQSPSITAIWWRINGGIAPYIQEYKWKVTINPDADQQDGHYELDPLVVVMPGL